MAHGQLRPPKFIAPQTPILSTEPPEGEGWIHEIKHDGFHRGSRRPAERSDVYRPEGMLILPPRLPKPKSPTSARRVRMRAKTQKCLLFSLALVALLPAPQAIAQDPAIRVRIELTTLYVISFHDDFSGLDMTGQAYGRMGFSFAGAGAPRPSLSVTMIWNRHECEPSIGTGCLISDSPPYTTDFGSHRSVNVSEMWLRQVWRTGGGETVLPFRQRNNLIDVKKS